MCKTESISRYRTVSALVFALVFAIGCVFALAPGKAHADDAGLHAGNVQASALLGTADDAESLSATVSFDPPLAGKDLVFQASVSGADAQECSYAWEASLDGGQSWTAVPLSTSATLVIPASLVSSLGAVDVESMPSALVRVTATAPDGRTALSNAQTVTLGTPESDEGNDSSSVSVKPNESEGSDASNDSQAMPADPNVTSEVTKTIVTAKPKSISKAKLAKRTYTGKAVKIVVKVGKAKLTAGDDYTIVVRNAQGKKISAKKVEAPGSYKVTIKGKGIYTGKATKTLKVRKAKIRKAAFAKITDQTVTALNASAKPAIQATFNGKTLKAGRDYTVTYRNNTKMGTAKAIVKGKGNFKGKKTLKFKIVSAQDKAISDISQAAQTALATPQVKEAIDRLVPFIGQIIATNRPQAAAS